jgi:hypothetical protein
VFLDADSQWNVLHLVGGIVFCLGFFAGLHYLALRPSHTNLRLRSIWFLVAGLGAAIFVFAVYAQRRPGRIPYYHLIQSSSSAARILRTVIGIIVGMAVFIFFARRDVSSTPDTNESTTSSQSYSEQSTTSPTIGDICTLRKPTAVAVSLEGAKRMYEFMSAKDRQGFDDLRLAGVVIIAPAGTKCRLISLPGWSGIWEVRLLDTNELVFVDREFLDK